MTAPFRAYLREISDKVEGVVGVSLLGLDGIAVDSLRATEEVPLESLGAELGSFVKSIRVSNTELNVGDVEQFALVTDKYLTFLSEVTSEYFVLLVLDRDGNYGRARYELMKMKFKLQDELT